jgi:hypothetical protein
MDETVTEPALFEEADFADASEEKTSPAVEESNEQPANQDEPTDSTDDSDAKEPQPGDEIEEFLAKKHIDKSDPDALRKIADMYRNAEQALGRNFQEKAKLERQIAESVTQNAPKGFDPIERIQALERQLQADRQVQATKEWKAAKNLSPEAEARMIDFLKEPIVSNGVVQKDNQGNPLSKYFLVSTGALSLDDVYRAVGGESVKADAIKQEVKEAVAKEIAAKQPVKSAKALSTNSTQFADAKNNDPFLDGLLGSE